MALVLPKTWLASLIFPNPLNLALAVGLQVLCTEAAIDPHEQKSSVGLEKKGTRPKAHLC